MTVQSPNHRSTGWIQKLTPVVPDRLAFRFLLYFIRTHSIDPLEGPLYGSVNGCCILCCFLHWQGENNRNSIVGDAKCRWWTRVCAYPLLEMSQLTVCKSISFLLSGSHVIRMTARHSFSMASYPYLSILSTCFSFRTLNVLGIHLLVATLLFILYKYTFF